MILSEIARLRKMPDLARKIETYEPQPTPVQQLEMQKMQAEIQKIGAEIEKLRSEAEENYAEADLDRAKARDENKHEPIFNWKA